MKALKFFGIFMLIIIALLVITMLVIPHFYKDKIAEIAKTEINKQLNAEVDFGEIDLSLFRNFPNFSLGLHDLTIINLPSDTLMVSKGIYITVGLLSVLKDETIKIKSITIEKPELFLKVFEDGTENWNVIKEADADEGNNKTESGGYNLLLNKVTVSNASIHYVDKVSNILFYMNGLSSSLKGKLTDERANLNFIVNSEDVTVLYDEIAYLQHAGLRFNAEIDANLKDKIYNLKNNVLYLNGLQINFEGSVAEVDNDLNFMLVYNTPDNSFKQLLSLIPMIYKEGYEDMVTKGQFNIDGYIKGVYSETDMPDFKLQMQASNAEISYPNMSSSINNIEFDFLVENKGNDLDNAVIRIDALSGNLGTDKVSASLQLLHPVSDPFIDLKAMADIKFENLRNVFPQESIQELTGDLKADFTLKGNLSAIERNAYQNFLAMGSVVCNHINYNLNEDYPISIQHAQFNFSPSQIDIIGFDSEINGNEIMVNGQINNYLGYFLKDELFKSNLKMISKTLDINQLLKPWSSTTTVEETEEDGDAVTYIPDNLDILILASADSVSYNEMSFTDFNSTIQIKDGRIVFEDMASSFLGGLINLQGYYEASPEINPHIDMDINLKDINIGSAYQYLSLFKQFTPIAEKAIGLFNTSFKLSVDLDNEMNPIWSTILGNGNFISDNIELNANELFSRISDVLKVDLFNNPGTGPIDASFKMLDGKIFHSPFNVEVNGIDMEVGGWTGFDQQIDYNVGFDIPLDMLGVSASETLSYYASEASKFGFDLGEIQSIKPVISIEGDASNPQIKMISIGKATGSSVKEIVKDKVEEVIDDYMEEANKEADRIIAEAQKKADSIVATAQKQVDQVMQLANQTVKDIKSEAQKQADQLVAEAAKQGALAELAAKKAASELLKSADNNANKALVAAQQESDKIMEKAYKQSEAIMQEALNKADMIRK